MSKYDGIALPHQVVAAAPCDVCGTMVAPSTLSAHYVNGRYGIRACTPCTCAIDEIRQRLVLAQARQRSALEGQLLKVVREVRSGVTDLPTFDLAELGA